MSLPNHPPPLPIKRSAPQDHALELRNKIAHIATTLGLERIGFAPLTPFERGAKALEDWLDKEYHGDMKYMADHPFRHDPAQLLPNAKTIISVAMSYAGHAHDDRGRTRLHGRVAHYARGRDYHRVLKAKLYALGKEIQELTKHEIQVRPCVDTAPILEHEAAALAGVGFISKSTLTLIPGLGTYVVLGELLIDIELPPSKPIEPRCGECKACLDACPTNAFIAANVLDARKCISYLTIEYDGVIPRELRPKFDNMIFGCDICQQVCPYNTAPQPRPAANEFKPFERFSNPALADILLHGSAAHKRFVSDSALRRASRNKLARNAAIALGNSSDTRAIGPLLEGLELHEDPIVRGHIVWALGELGGKRAQHQLLKLEKTEKDSFVLEEVKHALSRHAPA
ncbi:MAG: tRNA epoxyqueuosine(34) reductase QueG [Myxococcota bacterium]|nr:tRNA epoxyqueuosine(34) reductase QueG [Myxococcota bacterium]